MGPDWAPGKASMDAMSAIANIFFISNPPIIYFLHQYLSRPAFCTCIDGIMPEWLHVCITFLLQNRGQAVTNTVQNLDFFKQIKYDEI
jgi:hypothetical protein